MVDFRLYFKDVAVWLVDVDEEIVDQRHGVGTKSQGEQCILISVSMFGHWSKVDTGLLLLLQPYNEFSARITKVTEERERACARERGKEGGKAHTYMHSYIRTLTHKRARAHTHTRTLSSISGCY